MKIIFPLILGVIAALTHFVWLSLWLFPMAIYFLFSLLPGVSLPNFIRSASMLPSRILFIFPILFLIFYSTEFDLTRDIFNFHPNEREAIELFSLLLNALVFSIGIALCRNRALPVGLKRFGLVVFFVEFFQYVIGVNINENPQLYAYLIYVVVPLLVVDHFYTNKKIGSVKIIFTCILLFVILFFVFATRVPGLGIFVFIACYFLWPYLKNRPKLYYLFISIYFLLLLGTIIYYVYLTGLGSLIEYDDASENAFGKGVSGRMYIWPDLVQRIYDNLWTGMCSNCTTEKFYNFDFTRNISSHNTFLEIAFRYGLVGLALLFILVFSLAAGFRRTGGCTTNARFGFAYLMSSMLFMSSNEFGLTQTFVANGIFWFILGVCYGRTLPVSNTALISEHPIHVL